MNKYIFTLIIPIIFVILVACNKTVTVSSTKYKQYVEDKGVRQSVAELNIANIYPLSRMPSDQTGNSQQNSALKDINDVQATEITAITTIPEILNQINANDISNLTATAPAEMVQSVQPPHVIWTEVEYIKTMYTNTECSSYRYALYTSYQVTYYDVGSAVNVIAITSTGFYRLSNDRYIPCEYLSENYSQNSYATSRAVVYYDETSASASNEVIY